MNLTDMQTLAAAMLGSALLLSLAVGYLAFSVEKMVNITVTQPPITVQAPTALMPPEVAELLRALDAKLQAPKVPADFIVVDDLVAHGVALAEQSRMRGNDRFRIAREYVLGRAAEMNLDLNERDLALRIEAKVAVEKANRMSHVARVPAGG